MFRWHNVDWLMPHHSKLARSKAIQDAYSIASISVLDFLAPTIHNFPTHSVHSQRRFTSCTRRTAHSQDGGCQRYFLSALSSISSCTAHQGTREPSHAERDGREQRQIGPTRAFMRTTNSLRTSTKPIQIRHVRHISGKSNSYQEERVERAGSRKSSQEIQDHEDDILLGGPISFRDFYGDMTSTASRPSTLPPDFFSDHFEKEFAEGSTLPPSFYSDISDLKSLVPPPDKRSARIERRRNRKAAHSAHVDHEKTPQTEHYESNEMLRTRPSPQDGSNPTNERDENGNRSPQRILEDQVNLLKSVRDLEEKLAKARQDLSKVMTDRQEQTSLGAAATKILEQQAPVLLSKEDYTNLVDLYYYSHNSRFSPEASDLSPTPSFLDDVSFKVSEDFSKGDEESVNEDENYVSPLREVEKMLVSGKLREIAVMQVFVDLLIDDDSSNRALYDAYKNLPEPGVAYLPKGVIRLFLQRMSTPWTHSEKSMLRYLALIDDMQNAKLPITAAEWSSAVYLAGRSFAKVTDSDVAASFGVWQKMEKQAGVRSSHVTFNILFDIAVRAGKFALGQTILSEMSQRNLRLNRLGRVSLIYYHGLRGDGDGVRKTYRDFVEAGEIVDTLVLNCVIAALLNSQEPTAAEQVYERMKSLQTRLQNGVRDDGSEGLYMRYPPPASGLINQEMASNHLGRVLLKAKHLRDVLPENHQEAQAAMPLTPDIKTFSTMIAYHATKSGDLDRISVLLSEMTDMFDIPIQALVFQLLFKGFALHGPIGGPDGQWTVKRLEACWNACRLAIKNSDNFFPAGEPIPPAPTSTATPDHTNTGPILPSITEVNAIPLNAPLPQFTPPLHNPPQRRLSGWHEFVLDLAAFPRERLHRIERFHAQMFDEENAKKPHESRLPHTFASPFFQSTVYTSPEPALDHEEGEYVLPNPAETTLLQPITNSPTDHNEPQGIKPITSKTLQSRHNVTATRPLVCWLLRAYARNTRSRTKVEEIWGSVRKVWRPRDDVEAESVVRVLRRCLRDCDREGGG